MGPLIQMTTSRREATKVDQNEESRAGADVGGNGYFWLKNPKKMESRWQREYSVLLNISRSQAISFMKEAKLTYSYKAIVGFYLVDQELGMEICYQLRKINFSSMLPVELVENSLPMPSEGKYSHFCFILVRKSK